VTAVDIGFAALLVLSALWGFWRGLTRELVSMIAWVLIGVLVYRFASLVGHIIAFSAPEIVHVVLGASIIIVAGVVLAAIVGRLLRSVVAASQLAGADRMLGAVFGTLRGALVVLVLSAMVVEAGLSDSRLWRTSATGPYLEHVWHWMAGTVPARRMPMV
jgi:membrane protein required for colicin V production